MKPVERLHERVIYPRRISRLSEVLARLLPERARVLDIGSGDGALATAIARRRPDVAFEGVDVLVRPGVAIPTEEFDGRVLPHGDESYDAALLVDVVHHAEAPVELLAEARRVSREAVVIKDHLLEGVLAERTLRAMDRTGNERYGVALPFAYWPRERWRAVFDELALTPTAWEERLGIYPWPASLVFDRSLHFAARLEKRGAILAA